MSSPVLGLSDFKSVDAVYIPETCSLFDDCPNPPFCVVIVGLVLPSSGQAIAFVCEEHGPPPEVFAPGVYGRIGPVGRG